MTTSLAERPTLSKAQRSSGAETDQTLTTKKAYTTWANDHRLLKSGGRTYTIPAGAHFTKIQERCPFGQGYAEVTFSREEALKFYPYQELPGETLKVVIPHDFLYITPRKGSWKGECR
jgi:hypothetical protein